MEKVKNLNKIYAPLALGMTIHKKGRSLWRPLLLNLIFFIVLACSTELSQVVCRFGIAWIQTK